MSQIEIRIVCDKKAAHPSNADVHVATFARQTGPYITVTPSAQPLGDDGPRWGLVSKGTHPGHTTDTPAHKLPGTQAWKPGSSQGDGQRFKMECRKCDVNATLRMDTLEPILERLYLARSNADALPPLQLSHLIARL